MWRVISRIATMAVLGVAVTALLGASAQASVPGVIRELGCVADAASAKPLGCSGANGMVNTAYLALSPDGRNLYATARLSNSVLAFRRDDVSGRLTQLKGPAGCFDEAGPTHIHACAGIPGLATASGITVTQNGRLVYVAAPDSGAITAFARNTSTGALRRVACVSSDPSLATRCAADAHLDSPISLAVSRDGRTLYVGSRDGSRLLAFRATADGHLTELSCIQDQSNAPPATGCSAGTAVATARGLALSPDGRNLYLAARTPNAVTAFALNQTTGAIGTELGCVSGNFDTGHTAGCAIGNSLFNPQFLTVTADGRAVYVGVPGDNAVIILLRNPATGAISQSLSIDGCFSDLTYGTVSCHTALGLATRSGSQLRRTAARCSPRPTGPVPSPGSNAIRGPRCSRRPAPASVTATRIAGRARH
jgi:6-phosphogluconolactonase (cycloisomerase 2 family)